MAATDRGRQLTAAHRSLQARISRDTVRAMENLWTVLNAESRTPDLDAWLTAVEAVLRRQHAVSADTARAYYTAFRLAEIGQAGLAALPRPVFPGEAARTSLIVTGPVRVRQGVRRGLPLDEAAQKAAIEAARTAARIALEGGRQQVLAAVNADERALGWSRATSGTPCAFCALLASRGPAYKSERTADFDPHTGCNCSAEPTFSRDAAWPPGAAEFRELYNAATQGETDQLNAFRRAYEGR